MNKILFVVVIAAAIIAGLSIAYALKLEPAVALVDGAQAKIAELTAGGIDGQTVLTGGSIAATGASLAGAYNQFKGKISAQTSAVKETIQKTEALQQVEAIKNDLANTKTALTSQLDEATKIKDSALAEADSAKAQLSSLQEQNSKLQNQVDALHELIPDMKDKDLSAIVQNALKVS